MRTGFLEQYGADDRAAVAEYRGASRKSLRAMVNVVLTSINFLVPKVEASELSSGNSQESGQELDQEQE